MNRCMQQPRNGTPCPSPMPYMPQSTSYQVLAMAYVPMQTFQALYEPCEALENGTIFSELNKPFLGWKGGCRCQTRI